jgi:SOS response regulatory protein OraA/RecX
MPVVTGLRERPRGRVSVEVDGAPWRTLPADAVVRAELIVGTLLDRPRLRLLRRELKRSEALGTAVSALRRRDYSARGLDDRLERAGVEERERRAALGTLSRAGLVDDGRFARSRAAALAERGYGDEAIRWDLELQGVEEEAAERALAALASERERAAAIAERRGRSAATAAFLARRGFGEDSVETALGGFTESR